MWVVSQGANFVAPVGWLTQNDSIRTRNVTVTSVVKTGGGGFTVDLVSGGIQIGNMCIGSTGR